MSNSWSPIIYASTYIVDFRLVVKPDDFDEPKVSWATSHILVTTQLKGKNWAKELRQHPRWSLFKDESHCVIGVTCMADALSESRNKDKFGRPLYVFVGYVAKLSSTQLQLPVLDIKLFKDIYGKYVGERWDEKNHQTEKANKKAKAQYDQNLVCNDNFDLEELPKLNSERGKLWLFPEPETDKERDKERDKFLLAASQSDKPISICLGLPTRQFVSEGIFLNATAIDVSEKIETIIAPKQSTPLPQSLDEEFNSEKEKETREFTDPIDSIDQHTGEPSSKSLDRDLFGDFWDFLVKIICFRAKTHVVQNDPEPNPRKQKATTERETESTTSESDLLSRGIKSESWTPKQEGGNQNQQKK
ncbi:MAG: hypothetical protein ACFKPT_10515 [Gloeotrichia echinulata GP01]